jgi:hypothetical protein
MVVAEDKCTPSFKVFRLYFMVFDTDTYILKLVMRHHAAPTSLLPPPATRGGSGCYPPALSCLAPKKTWLGIHGREWGGQTLQFKAFLALQPSLPFLHLPFGLGHDWAYSWSFSEKDDHHSHWN